MAASGGAPGSAVATPNTPLESTIDGNIAGSIPSTSQVCSFQVP
jgi:hypothetical protein